ncbi:MAG TPA: FGLLP motif-containing membrane protein [candidate division Zixibacteria bacterium]|nr:FGLLP motif-containing membrane protein [candidate division Zixibacteria bacterium]
MLPRPSSRRAACLRMVGGAALLLAILLTGAATVAGAELVPPGVCGPDETTFDDEIGVNPVNPSAELLDYDGCSGIDPSGASITVWAYTAPDTTGEEMIAALERGDFAVLGWGVARETMAGRTVVVVDLAGTESAYYWYTGNTLYLVQTASPEAAERAIRLVAAGGVSLPAAVPGPQQISLDPVVLATSAAAAAGVAFAVPFPGTLFNSTLDANYGEITGWFRRLGRGATSARVGIGARIGPFFATNRGVTAFILAASVMYGFLDPSFGLSLESVLTVIGLAAGIGVLAIIGQLPVRAYTARRLGEPGRLEIRLGGLLVGLGCVLITRITDFQPGYLYGLVLGFAFSRDLDEREEGVAAAIGAGTSLVLAFVAFLTLGALRAPFGEATPTWLLPAEVALVTVIMGGIEDVVFGLIPVRFLPGEALLRWSRVAWAALFGIAVFGFLHVLINPASGYLVDTTLQPLSKVVILAVGFGAVSVLFWAYFRYRKAPPTEPTAPAPAA